MRIDPDMPILIVDDYHQMLRIIGNLLKEIGYTNITTASDGAQALRTLRKNDFGMIISDWNMEPMTGYQLLEEIRADEGLHDLPFIMVTAESKTENVIAAKHAGVSNYIVKPFTALTLKEKIDQVFADY
ncbi:response regulator [Minwuia sp.]|uniref:response regulator n=1 Tax=Minwuia sp. TaxID=2493630 RepID=UPI003A8E021B